MITPEPEPCWRNRGACCGSSLKNRSKNSPKGWLPRGPRSSLLTGRAFVTLILTTVGLSCLASSANDVGRAAASGTVVGAMAVCVSVAIAVPVHLKSEAAISPMRKKETATAAIARLPAQRRDDSGCVRDSMLNTPLYGLSQVNSPIGH